jgi:oligo-1,6-glucosidase
VKLLRSLALPIALLLCSQAALTQAAKPSESTTINGYHTAWWKDAVVYQVYPRSFKDSNGDGIGDLNGVTSKLDYLQQLGINVIWLSPHFDSPNADNGYDIRDYRKVMTEFGTMADFDRMLAAIKKRHMRLIIDLVVNHTSDEHRWFVESAKSKDNPYRDYYIWRDGKPNPANPSHPLPPNNYFSFFSGSAWEYSKPTNQFYLHLFTVKQPDLNWDNPKVRQEVYSLMRFWLDKGVDGFRMDVIPLISKPTGMPDIPLNQMRNIATILANGPHRDEYLQEMNREVLSKYDDMSVGEALGITVANTPQLVDDRRHELNMIFNFDAVRINRNGRDYRTWALPEFKAIYTDHARRLGTHDWDTVFLSNHDNPRLVSSFGDDSPAFRGPSAKLLATLILSMRGTPFLYQGDELGMTNFPFQHIEQFDDVEVKNAYKADVLTGKIPESNFLEGLRHTSRDNARTPMQWNDTSNGGFTTAPKPWLAENPNYKDINAAQELADPNSVYHYTQRMIALRHRTPALVYGEYQDLDPANPQIFIYTRTLPDSKGKPAEHYLVVLNMSKAPLTYTLPSGMSSGKLILANSTTTETGTTLHLTPWESRIYKY